MNMLGRKKLKSRSPVVPESRSFLVRYRRTYVLKNTFALWLDDKKKNVSKASELNVAIKFDPPLV
jgi:hypothetical protein